MRVFLALILFSTSTAGALPPAESRAMGRVFTRLWPSVERSTQVKLAQQLADDVHRGHSHDHRQKIFNAAEVTAELMRRALQSRRAGGPGLSDEGLRDLIVALVNGYQVAAAERYDEVNGATCAVAAGGAGVILAPFCVALGLDGSLLTGEIGVGATLIATLAAWTVFATIGTVYGIVGGDELGRKLPVLPGMRRVAMKWPGSNHLMFFWDTVDQRLGEEPEWIAARGAEPRRANEYLDRFVALLALVSPEGQVPHACQGLLER